MKSTHLSEDAIKKAAKDDFKEQTKYDNAYDRQKGFIQGAKWAIKQIKINQKNENKDENYESTP